MLKLLEILSKFDEVLINFVVSSHRAGFITSAGKGSVERLSSEVKRALVCKKVQIR